MISIRANPRFNPRKSARTNPTTAPTHIDLRTPHHPRKSAFQSAQICEKQPNHRAYPHSPINIKTPLDYLHPRKSAFQSAQICENQPNHRAYPHSPINIKTPLDDLHPRKSAFQSAQICEKQPNHRAYPHRYQNTTPSAQICVSIRANPREPTQPPPFLPHNPPRFYL